MSTKEELLNERERLMARLQAIDGELSDMAKREEEERTRKAAMLRLSPQEKVALFSSLFRGRDDVFARRWASSASGKSGYQPVCANEWRPGVCDKRTAKCAECPHRQFSPPGYDDYYRHLAGRDEMGRDVMGAYAITADGTCHFLCADFDDKGCSHGYKEDVQAYVGVCRDWDVPCSIERSRSGNGSHVWIFFGQAIAAAKARRLGNLILTEAMGRNGRMSFKSYDRFFPNQDYIEANGLGNLVALPLQGQARKRGNSVFVDDGFNPYADQWDYLQKVGRMDEAAVDAIIARNATTPPLGSLARTSEAEPWAMPTATAIDQSDMPNEVTAICANMLYFKLGELPPKVVDYLKRMASFRNPEFYSRRAMRISTYSTPRIISCADLTDEYLTLPRGCEDAVKDFFESKGSRCQFVDKTCHGRAIDVVFNGSLRKDQQEAIARLAAANNGTLHAATAFGKTVAAIGLIAQMRVNTLILVHTKALLAQWQKALTTFLTINHTVEEAPHRRGRKKPTSVVGTLSSDGNTLHGIIDVAVMQSCIANGEAKPMVRGYGLVIADECHHVSAVSFEQVMKAVDARRVYGLTATPIRKDGHQPIIFMQCGPIRYSTDAKAQMAKQGIERLLVPRFTHFTAITDSDASINRTMQLIAESESRNLLIVGDVCSVLTDGRTPIVLTSRTAHVAALAELLRPHCPNVITLVGSESAKEKREKRELLERIPPTERLAVVATGKYVGEGFDYPRLDTLMLAMPVSWHGIVQQYVGRLHREYPGKSQVLVYDYVDLNLSVCEKMYRRRLKGYYLAGYQIKTDRQLEGMTPSSGVIYDGTSFLQPFLESLRSARRSIVIACPRLRIGCAALPIRDRLAALAPQGVEIAVLTKGAGDGDKDGPGDVADTTHLARQGIKVVVSPGLTLNCAVIDSATVWYGSVSILGYHSSADNLITFRDPSVATTLLELLLAPR